MSTLTTTDDQGVTIVEVIITAHHTHDTSFIEIIRDNPVEFTRWAHCNTCDELFAEKSVTILDAPWMHDDG